MSKDTVDTEVKQTDIEQFELDFEVDIAAIESVEVSEVEDMEINLTDKEIEELNNPVSATSSDDSFDLGDLFADVEMDTNVQVDSKDIPESYYAFDNSAMSDSYSEAFLDEETNSFIEELRTTLLCLSNPTKTIEETKPLRIFNKRRYSEYSDYINIMKQVLDIVRVYNNTKNKEVLPINMRDAVKQYEILKYNDTRGRVWNEIDIRIKNSIKSDSQKLNKYLKDIVEIRNLYSAYCESYEVDDASARASKIKYDRNARINKIEFAFYNQVLEELSNGEKVALCNNLTFGTNDKITYKFQCGSCKAITAGTDTIYDANDNEIKEGDNHSFYQVLTKNARSLFFPMICSECGAINCLSASTRQLMKDNIRKAPTAESHDTTDYLSDNYSEKGKMLLGDRRWIPYTKWMDLLDTKLVREDVEVDLSMFEDLTQDQILDKDFYINIEEVSNSEDIVSDINDDDYVNAIKSFRQRNDMLNTKRFLDTKQDVVVEPTLALLASKGTSTLLNNIYDLLASHIIGTKTFARLEDALESKNQCYDFYSTLQGAATIIESGEAVNKYAIDYFESYTGVTYDLDKITASIDEAYSDYVKARSNYEAIKVKIFNNPKVFALRKKEKINGAILRMVRAFEFDNRLSKFFEELLSEAIINISMTDIKSSLGMIHLGKRLSAEPVKGLSAINDKDHLQSNKYKIAMDYYNRVAKASNISDQNIKAALKEFNETFTVYNKFNEWKDMFNMSMSTTVDSIVGSSNGAVVAYYNNNLKEFYEDLKSYSGSTIEVFEPKFTKIKCFSLLFGEDVLSDKDLTHDASELFNTFLSMSNFQIYDIITCKLLCSEIGFKEFTGLNNNEIARNLKLTNSLVMKLYDKCRNAILTAMSVDSRNAFVAEKILKHTFMHPRNDAGEIEVFESIIKIGSEKDDDYSQNINDAMAQYTFVKAELSKVKDFDIELNIEF